MKLAQRVAFNASIQLVGQAVVVIGGIAAVAVAARYLGLRDYGALITATVFVSLFTLVTDFGVSAIGGREIAKLPEAAERIVWSLIVLGTVTALGTAAVAYGISLAAYGGEDHARTREAILILLLPLLVSGPRSAANAYLVARQQVYLSTYAAMATRVVSLVAVVIVAAADLGLVAMVLAYAAIPVVETALTFLLARRAGMVFARVWDAPLTRSLLRASAPMGGVMLLNSLYFRLDLLLLSLLSTTSAVALYGVAYKVVEGFMALPSYLMVTLLPDLARAEPRSERLGSLMQNAFAAMQLVAVPIVALSFFGDELMRFVGGGSFDGGALALQLLMLGVAFSYIQAVFGYALVAQNKQYLAFVNSGVVLVVNLVLNLILIPPFGVEGAAAALVATELLSLVSTMWLYRRVGPIPGVHAPVRTLVAGAAMVGVVLAAKLLIPRAFDSPLATLVIGGSLASLLYFVVLARLDAFPAPLRPLLAHPLLRRLRVARAAG